MSFGGCRNLPHFCYLKIATLAPLVRNDMTSKYRHLVSLRAQRNAVPPNPQKHRIFMLWRPGWSHREVATPSRQKRGTSRNDTLSQHLLAPAASAGEAAKFFVYGLMLRLIFGKGTWQPEMTCHERGIPFLLFGDCRNLPRRRWGRSARSQRHKKGMWMGPRKAAKFFWMGYDGWSRSIGRETAAGESRGSVDWIQVQLSLDSHPDILMVPFHRI